MKRSSSSPLVRQGLLMLGLLMAWALPAQEVNPHAAWQYTQNIDAPGAGLVRFELPSSTLGESSSRLDDLRLVSPQGVETPYVVEWPQLASVETRPAAAFRTVLRDQATLLDIDTGISQPIHAVTLATSHSSFIKAAMLEGSNDAQQWQPLAQDEILFRQEDGTQRLRLPFSPGTWKHLRVTLNDARIGPVIFTSAMIELEQPSTPAIPLPLVIQKREELRGHTKITLPLGGAHLWLASVRIQSSEPVFSRRVQVFSGDALFASETLFRVALEGREVSMFAVPVMAQAPSAELVLDIDNGDSPPLKIDGVEASRYPVKLAFQAGAAGQWQLFTGNVAARAPVYDVAALAGQLRNAASIDPSVSALVPNPAFNKSATLPETGTNGAAIDLQGWTFRKPVPLAEHGVMQLELDLETLAHASPTFADLRLVQGGHQLPYLLQQTTKTRAAEVTMTPTSDANRPTISRWELKLPVPGMPLTTLNAVSSTPLFSRHLTLSEYLPWYGDKPSLMVIGSAEWSQKPGANSPLTLLLRRSVISDRLFLEADNGDNAPLTIDKVTVSYPVVQLLFKTTETAPVELYYGNSRASPPRYDLSLVKAELEAAAPVIAKLGGEERLKAERSQPETSSTGSPWLWAALALVVGGLLWIVAKLLPPTEK